MIQVSIFVGVAVLLLLLLFSIGSGREIAEETNEELLERPRRRSAPEPGPAACARRVFSPQDRVFVEGCTARNAREWRSTGYTGPVWRLEELCGATGWRRGKATIWK
jgi:hypothetical protein